MGPVENDATRNAGERIRDIKKSRASLDDGKRLDRIACVYGRRYGRRGTSSEQGGVRRGGKTDISKLQGGSRKPRKQMGRARESKSEDLQGQQRREGTTQRIRGTGQHGYRLGFVKYAN